MKILLLDDDIFLRDMYSVKFTEAGHEIEVAKDAQEARSMLQEHDFDVVITDMVIPGESGLEFLASLKEDEDTNDITKIVLSNQSEPGDIEAAKKQHVDGYLVKADLIPSEVVREVQEIVNQKT